MAEEKDTDSTSESGAAARSGETDDLDPVEPGHADVDAADDDERPQSVPQHSADVDDRGDDVDTDSDVDAAEEDSERELVGVGAGTAAAGSGSAGSDRGSRRTRQPKGRPTPKRKNKTEEPARTTPISFIKGSISELKQVVYPTGSQLLNYFVVVLVFVLFIIAIVTALDAGFGWLMLKVFA